MRRFGLFTVMGLIFLLTITSSVTAAPLASVEFSAETHMRSAKGESSEGHIFVGNDAVRTEMTQNGQQLIQIINTATQVTWIIRPAQRAYIELQGKGAWKRIPVRVFRMPSVNFLVRRWCWGERPKNGMLLSMSMAGL